jgi:hypothetical protein
MNDRESSDECRKSSHSTAFSVLLRIDGGSHSHGTSPPSPHGPRPLLWTDRSVMVGIWSFSIEDTVPCQGIKSVRSSIHDVLTRWMDSDITTYFIRSSNSNSLTPIITPPHPSLTTHRTISRCRRLEIPRAIRLPPNRQEANGPRIHQAQNRKRRILHPPRMR